MEETGKNGGLLLAQVHQLSQRVFSKILREHGIDQLNPAQGRVVFALWQEDGLTQTELVKRTKLDKSTLTIMLDRLESAGMITRSSPTNDARVRTVNLTERNKQLHPRYLKASEEMLERYYRGISSAEIDVFENVLKHIIANLEAS